MKRIDFIASLLSNSDIVLDIGSDHGLVLKKAFDCGYLKSAIATDLNDGPLNNAKKNLQGYDVTYYKSDGFKDLPELQYDTVVIAGMGAYLICDILDYAKKDAKFIIQSNAKQEVLRAYLMNNGFKIIDEHVIFDDFYYVIIEAIFGEMLLSENELYVGSILKLKPESVDYYQHKINQIMQISNSLDFISEQKYRIIKGYYQNALEKQTK